MPNCRLATAALVLALASSIAAQDSVRPPMRVGAFDQQTQRAYTTAEGLPSNDVQRIVCDEQGVILALTRDGLAAFRGERWEPLPAGAIPAKFAPTPLQTGLPELPAGATSVRAVTHHNGEYAVATAGGLFLGGIAGWEMALPRQEAVRWAPEDVRAVAYDAEGRLWFACPQGVGYRIDETAWRLFTGAEGLPFNDFTCMAAGPRGVWFGTTNGAIRYHEGIWEFRQGRRWLLDNHVRDIAIDAGGNAWFATAAGVSCIAFHQTTLAEKAVYFEEEIDARHRRTRFGYVNPAIMTTPGDKSTARPEATDNDGHYGGLYLGAASLGYAATGRQKLREDAVQAFESLAFLSEVTAGGTHPAPAGFIARAIEPTNGPDPNEVDNAERDQLLRDTQDALWKVISPRWPVDATGEWYWKCDSSSDELDGYYFGFGIYFDRVCETEAEKARVRQVVRAMTDHLLDHNYRLVDHDGLPTRWAQFAPEDLNQNPAWWVERGLNSLSILTYLSVTHHITGEQKYRDAYLELAIDHGYAMNGMTQPKFQWGKGSFGQGDDNMAFMNYYHLLRYETDPNLLNMYRQAVFRYWNIEKYERNPFFNFVYAACCLDKEFKDHWRTVDLSPTGAWLAESVDTLKRYPLDLIDWPNSNAHRIDMTPLPGHVRLASGQEAPAGQRVDGQVFLIDEQPAFEWGEDFWLLSHQAEGTLLRHGTHFLLAYYLGLVHGYLVE